ncbi:MAG TPA: enoyl-CoA hydratase-related protein [Thermodesulfobacteriota bacterium]
MTVRVEVDGTVATLVVDNPPLNVITDTVRAGLLAGLAECEARRVRAVVLTGAGERAFSAGADLREEETLTRETVRPFLEADEAVLSRIERYPGAVIAAVRGYAYGGGFELALACDIRVAGESARFAGVGVKVGLIASTARLTRLAGETVARDLLLTGRTVPADEALELGLVSRVVPDVDLLAESAAVARVVAERAPLAVRANKAAMLEAAGPEPLAGALARERARFAALQATRDHREALAAFFEKRPARFTGE